MTSDCVRALSARYRTPRSRSPFETPVAATMASFGASSSFVKHLLHVLVAVLARLCDLTAGDRPELGLELAAEAAQRGGGDHRLARAADADREVVVRAANRAAVIAAVTSPSWMSLIRAPDWRSSSSRSWWRGRSSTIAVRSFVFLPSASAIASYVVGDGLGQIDATRARRADRHLADVHLRQPRKRAGVADRDHRHRAVSAAGDDAGPSSGSTREVDGLASAADERVAGSPLVSSSELPITTRPSIGIRSRAARIPEVAASAAPATSPRPSHRPLASAARSVTAA